MTLRRMIVRITSLHLGSSILKTQEQKATFTPCLLSLVKTILSIYSKHSSRFSNALNSLKKPDQNVRNISEYILLSRTYPPPTHKWDIIPALL
jgi:hypothetical protein